MTMIAITRAQGKCIMSGSKGDDDDDYYYDDDSDSRDKGM